MTGSDQVIDQLRATFDAVACETRLSEGRSAPSATASPLVATSPTRARPRRLVYATVVVAAVIAGAVLVQSNRSVGDRTRVGTSDEPTVTTEPSLDRGVTPPTLALPGWVLISSNADPVALQDTEANRLFLVFEDPQRGFAGPRIKVGVTAQPSGSSAGLNAHAVDINGTTAQLGTGNGKVYLTWSPKSARQIYVTGTGATIEQVLSVARGLRIASDLTNITAASVPSGLRVTQLPALSSEPALNAEYKFQRGDTLLQVDLYPGGRTALEGRIGDPAHNVEVRGVDGAINDDTTYGPPGGNPDLHSYRVDYLDGQWAVEIAGGPFPDQTTFLAAVNAIQVSG